LKIILFDFQALIIKNENLSIYVDNAPSFRVLAENYIQYTYTNDADDGCLVRAVMIKNPLSFHNLRGLLTVEPSDQVGLILVELIERLVDVVVLVLDHDRLTLGVRQLEEV